MRVIPKERNIQRKIGVSPYKKKMARSYISFGMTKASRKRQQVALKYVQEAAARRTRLRTASSIQYQRAQQQAAAGAAAAQAALVVPTASTSTTQLLLLYVCSLSPAVAAHCYLHCRIYRKAISSRSCYQLAMHYYCCCSLLLRGMYGIVCTSFVHTDSSILNLHLLCSHHMQQHCLNILVVSYIYLVINAWRKNIRMCTRITRTYLTCTRFRLFHTNPGLALVEENHD